MQSLSAPPNEGEWWTICSTAELRQIVSVGVAGGDRFDQAVREIERRASEANEREEAAEAERMRQEALRTRMLRVAVVVAGLVLVVILGIALV